MAVPSSVLASAGSQVPPLFALLTLVIVSAVFVSLLLVRFRQSLLTGYLLTGIIIANVGIPGISGAGAGDGAIATLAEIGVVLLMFTLGIEFSFSELRHAWRTALIGGGLQVFITAGLVGGLAWLFGFAQRDAVVLAIAVALSSTAVAMKSFQDFGRQNSPAARASLGIALFQDILVILVFLVMPAVDGGGGAGLFGGMAGAIAKGALFLAGAWLLGRYGINPLLHAVAATRSRELFTLTVVGLCAGVALAGGALELSLALGAFAAGLVVSESIYSHRILADILPFKDLFLAIFFVSVGLLIEVPVVLAHWEAVVAGSLLILTVKGAIVYGVLKVLRLPPVPAVLAAGSLASTGEFSLVLIGKAGGYRPLDPATEQMLLVCTALTMAAVPSLMRGAVPFGRWLEHRAGHGARKVPESFETPGRRIRALEDHAIICGYGPVGRALNEALARCGLHTLVIDLNADTVRSLKRQGQDVLFADVRHPEALDLAGIRKARMVAFTFPVVEVACEAVPLIRERNPDVPVFARARFRAEADRLRELGVTVVHDEREAAVEMVRAAVSSYERPDLVPEEIVRDIMEQEG